MENQERLETLGPAERIITALLTHNDHLYHGRPGVVRPDARTNIGVRWEPVTWKEDNGQKVVYRKTRIGNKESLTRIGTLSDDGKVHDDAGSVYGEYRSPGLFPEAVTWIYRQIADVYHMDNEFVARWASWAFPQEHRDLKAVLAAFLLVQDRKGEPVRDEGEVIFFDDDYRDIGEAICLIRNKGRDIDPKMLLRIGDILRLEGVAQINRELGFGRSARRPPMGRYQKVVDKYLRYREENPRMLQGLVKAGYKGSVQKLARRVGYKPNAAAFFQVLRWKQKQAKDGRREIAIGEDVTEAESWENLSEAEICQRIVDTKPNYKRIVGMLPAKVGLTRAVMAAAIEAGSVSDNDLIILSPTLEELGLLNVKPIHDRWKRALKKAENQRAANVARRVKKQEVQEALTDSSEKAAQKTLEEVTRGLRIYFFVDISSSMGRAIKKAKEYLIKLLPSFDLDRIHVATFNTVGREVHIRAPKAAAVEHAFKGIRAGGGTIHAAGVKALAHYKPKEDEDALFFFVGDQGDNRAPSQMVPAFQAPGLNPVAIAMLNIRGNHGMNNKVEETARRLGVPFFEVDDEIFKDPYAVPRTLRHLIASTPVGQAPVRKPRKTLVQQILETPLLTKPVWAS